MVGGVKNFLRKILEDSEDLGLDLIAGDFFFRWIEPPHYNPAQKNMLQGGKIELKIAKKSVLAKNANT